MNMNILKAVGAAESKLAKKDLLKQKNSLEDFKSDPEVAKALGYLDQYREELPESHPVFKHVEALKKRQENKSFVKDVIKNKTTSKKASQEQEDKEEQEKKIKEAQAICQELNSMVRNLENECDKVFEYLSHSQRALSVDYRMVSSSLKLKRFLTSMKSGFNGVKI